MDIFTDNGDGGGALRMTAPPRTPGGAEALAGADAPPHLHPSKTPAPARRRAALGDITNTGGGAGGGATTARRARRAGAGGGGVPLKAGPRDAAVPVFGGRASGATPGRSPARTPARRGGPLFPAPAPVAPVAVPAPAPAAVAVAPAGPSIPRDVAGRVAAVEYVAPRSRRPPAVPPVFVDTDWVSAASGGGAASPPRRRQQSRQDGRRRPPVSPVSPPGGGGGGEALLSPPLLPVTWPVLPAVGGAGAGGAGGGADNWDDGPLPPSLGSLLDGDSGDDDAWAQTLPTLVL